MWAVAAVQRQKDHIMGRSHYHGPDCTLCRVSRMKVRGASKSTRIYPVGRDTAMGLTPWSKRVLPIEPKPSALTKLLGDMRFKPVPFDGMNTVAALGAAMQDGTQDDIVAIVTPYPIPGVPPKVLDIVMRRKSPKAQVIFVWTTARRPHRPPRGCSSVSFYTNGGKHSRLPDFPAAVVEAMGRHQRVSWTRLRKNLKGILPNWNVFAHNALGDDDRKTFMF